jgi:NADH-quinone oxidoreductase subunit J
MPLFYTFNFYLFGIIAVASALAFVTRKSPVAAALWLVNTMFSLAALYVMLDAHFIGVIQVLVYAGAIMVLVVFVIMLLNLGNEDSLRERFSSREGLGILASLFIGGAVIYAVMQSVFAGRPVDERLTNSGTIDAIGKALFTDYVFPFEMVSLVLLAAVVGAVVLTKRHLE